MSSLPYVGNYSLQPGQVIPIPYLESNSKKRYLLAVQKGKPVLDEELVESNFRDFDLVCKYLERNVGTAALGSNSFKITQSAITTVSNFSITGGTVDDPAILVVKGYPSLLFSTIEYNQQDATGSLTDDDYTKTLIPGISVPATDRIDAVYIDIYLAEVSSELGSEYQDVTLKDPILAIQTSNRFRIVQDILVSEGNTTIPSDGLDINGIYHRYYKLAEIQRHTGIADIYNADITDTRVVVTSLKDISNGIGDIHVNNATVDNDLTVHGTVTIINTTETNAESLKITSDDAGINAVEIIKSNSGHALVINKIGTDHALIVNTGNSGFGTSNPIDKVTIHHGRLSIIGSYTGTPVIQLSGEDATAGILRTTNAVPLFLGANNVTRISIAPGTASVGIATDIPDATVALDVNGILRVRSGAPGDGKLLKSDANGVAEWVSQTTISDDDWDKSGNDVVFNKPGGMVGIQTTNPSGAALDVNGLIRMRSGASAGKIIASDANGVFSWINPTAISDGDWVLTDTRMYNSTATVVGIGTNNPDPALGKLQVNGVIYSTGLIASAISGSTVSLSGSVTCVGLAAGIGNIATTGTISGSKFAGSTVVASYVDGYQVNADDLFTGGGASLSGLVTCVGLAAGAGNIATTGTISGSRFSGSTVTAFYGDITGTLDAYIFNGGSGNIFTDGNNWSVGIGTISPGLSFGLVNDIVLDLTDYNNFSCSFGIKRSDNANDKFYIICQGSDPGSYKFHVRSDGQCSASEHVAGAGGFVGATATTSFKVYNNYTFATANVDYISSSHVQDVNFYTGHQATSGLGGGMWIHDYTGSHWGAIHAGIVYAADGIFTSNSLESRLTINGPFDFMVADTNPTWPAYPQAQNINFYAGMTPGGGGGGIWVRSHDDGGFANIAAANFNVVSDIRLKENIVNMSNAINIVSQLQGVEFSWKNDAKRCYGFIAQDVEKVIPSIVSIGDYNGLVDHRSLDYSKIVPFAVEAIKSLQNEINKIKLAVGIA